jgi:hypothetical protein
MPVKERIYRFLITAFALLAIGSSGNAVLAQDFETTTTQPLLVDQKTGWKELKLDVVRIDENDPDIQIDDRVVLFLQIGDAYYERTFKPFQFDSVENYEIYAKEIRSESLNAPGHVVLRLRYIPPTPKPKFLSKLKPPRVKKRSAPKPAKPDQPAAARKSLRVGRELVLGSLRIRLTRVSGNDPRDKTDDTATFFIRTPHTSFSTTIGKYHSEFIDECEIYVEDVRPSGTRGGGRCTIVVRCGR